MPTLIFEAAGIALVSVLGLDRLLSASGAEHDSVFGLALLEKQTA
jgi:hypothetical protein